MVQIYYYCDKSGFERIIKDRKIVTHPRIVDGKTVANGIYLNEIKPDYYRIPLVINNFKDMERVLNEPKLPTDREFYVRINSEDFPDASKRLTDKWLNEWTIPYDIYVGECVDRFMSKQRMTVGKGEQSGDASVAFGYMAKCGPYKPNDYDYDWIRFHKY